MTKEVVLELAKLCYPGIEIRLGRVCRVGHRFQGFNYCVRRFSNYNCLDCEKTYRKDYHETHKELENKRSKQYYQTNSERAKQAVKNWRANNRNRHNQNSRLWHRQNKLYVSKLRKKRKLKIYSVNAKRRATQLNAFIEPRNEKAIREHFKDCCAYCGQKVTFSGEIEHAIALVKGGKEENNNLVLSCQTCNRTKGIKDVWQWWYFSGHWDHDRILHFVQWTHLTVDLSFLDN